MFFPLSFYTFSAGINFLTSSVLGSLLLIKSGRDTTNRIFGYFCLSVGFWSLFFTIWTLTEQKTLAEFFLRTCMLGVFFMPALFFHFVVSFLDLRRLHKFIALNYGISAFFALFVYTPFYAEDPTPFLVFPYWLNARLLCHLGIAHFMSIVLLTFYLLICAYLHATGEKRNQLLYLLVGTGVGYACGALNFFAWYKFPIPPFLNIFISVYVLMTFYAIVRYRLLDIRIAITKVGIFFLVYALVLSIPLWLGYRHHLWQHAMWLMLVLATSGPYIYSYLRRQAEGKLLQQQKSYQKTLKQAAYGIGKIKNLDTLVALLERILTRTVGIQSCGIYQADGTDKAGNLSLRLLRPADALPTHLSLPGAAVSTLLARQEPFTQSEIREIHRHSRDNHPLEPLQQHLSAEILLPITLSNKLLALIALGKKDNDALYTDEDLTVFSILASQAGLAMENCLFIAAEQERLQREGARARRESMDMLVSTMAHEIDNPIASVIGNVDLLREYIKIAETDIPEKMIQPILQAIGHAERDATRVSKIIKAVEDYSKVGEGKLENVSIDDIIEPYRTLLVLVRKNVKGVNYTEDIEAGLPPVLADRILLEEILINFVENAFHAVRDSDVKNIALRIFRHERALRIEVTDSGYGIAPKVRPHLFEVPATTKASSEGTGIGLYRVRQICTILHAAYGATSPGEGKGSTFYVEIPLAPV